jgi:hypothetical protein
MTLEEKRIHALLLHENVHSERQAADWSNLLRYRFSRSFRLNEEKLAYHAQLAQLAEYRIPVNFTWFAGALSGRVYGHMVEFDEAYRWVRKVITNEADITFMFDSIAVDEEFKRKLRLTVADEKTSELLAVYRSFAPLKGKAWLFDRLLLLAFAALVFGIEFVVIWILSRR